MKGLVILAIMAMVGRSVRAQDSIEFFLTANVNQYIPRTASKGMFPVLGYDADVKSKVLIGGFGAGVCRWIRMYAKSSIRAQANISRAVYWEEVNFYDQTGADLGHFPVATADITLTPSATWHVHAGTHFSFGTGLACRAMLLSYSRLRQEAFAGGRRGLGINRYYRPFVVSLPVEMAIRWDRTFFNIRYEHGLQDRLKRDLAAVTSDRHGIIYLELGFRFR